MARITGGGLVENIPRMLPKDVRTWSLPPAFSWLNVDPLELARTFNTGIGMVLVVPERCVQDAVDELEKVGETVYRIGRLVKRTEHGCVLKSLDSLGLELQRLQF